MRNELCVDIVKVLVIKWGVTLDISKQGLIDKIDAVFPSVEMPPLKDFLFHENDGERYAGLLSDIDEFRGGSITGDAVRIIHKDMSKLSAKAWCWIFPHYLKYCLTPEAEFNRMETEFLIYALSPSPEFSQETFQRLSEFNNDQVNCVIDFLNLCLGYEYWKELYAGDIDHAINFLKSYCQK